MAEIVEEKNAPPKEKNVPLRERIVPRKKGKLGRWLLVLFFLALLVVGGYEVWRYLNTYESTDDAQIDGNINPISARISGYITEVPVEDEQRVKAGDVLVRIDPRDYQVALAQAEADLHNAEAAAGNLQIQVPITGEDVSAQLKSAMASRANAEAALESAQRQLRAAEEAVATAQAQVKEAEANYKTASDNVERYRLLVEKNEIARQTYDTAVDQAAANRATVDARRAGVLQAEQNVGVQQAAIEQARQQIVQADASIQSARTGPQQVVGRQAQAKAAAAQVQQKQAVVDQAKLNLSYTTIASPVTGIVGSKTAQVGQNVTPGQQLMAVVPLEDIWVTANFKETQLRRMKPGQRVTFTVDAYSGEYKGRVYEIGGASGSRFSILPPENATGNYVKVVQRIPVRIVLDPGENADHRLRVGMSVTPKVYLY